MEEVISVMVWFTQIGGCRGVIAHSGSRLRLFRLDSLKRKLKNPKNGRKWVQIPTFPVIHHVI